MIPLSLSLGDSMGVSYTFNLTHPPLDQATLHGLWPSSSAASDAQLQQGGGLAAESSLFLVIQSHCDTLRHLNF